MLTHVELLTKEQHEAYSAVQERMIQHLIEETEAFYKVHPELRLHWELICNPIIRDPNSEVLKP